MGLFSKKTDEKILLLIYFEFILEATELLNQWMGSETSEINSPLFDFHCINIVSNVAFFYKKDKSVDILKFEKLALAHAAKLSGNREYLVSAHYREFKLIAEPIVQNALFFSKEKRIDECFKSLGQLSGIFFEGIFPEKYHAGIVESKTEDTFSANFARLINWTNQKIKSSSF